MSDEDPFVVQQDGNDDLAVGTQVDFSFLEADDNFNDNFTDFPTFDSQVYCC
jgi:hypothetical protein